MGALFINGRAASESDDKQRSRLWQPNVVRFRTTTQSRTAVVGDKTRDGPGADLFWIEVRSSGPWHDRCVREGSRPLYWFRHHN